MISVASQVSAPVSTDRAATHRSRVWLTFIVLQACHIVCLSIATASPPAGVLIVSGILCLFQYGWLIRTEVLASSNAVSPFVLYLCAAWMILGASPVWAGVTYAYGFDYAL